MRAFVGACLSVGLCLAFAGSAAAGTFDPPIEADACGSFNTVESMNDPNGAFSDVNSQPLCEKLCRKAAKQCASYAKKTFSCVKGWVKEARSWQNQNCDINYSDDPEVRKECKDSAKAEAANNNELSEIFRDIALDACDDWQEECEDSCLVF